MRSETKYRAGLALFGVVAACAMLAGIRALAGEATSLLALCCRLMEMPLAADAAIRNALAARAAVAVLLTLSIGFVFRRAWRTRGFVTRLPSVSVKALPASVGRLLDELGLTGHTAVIASEAPLAFCAGWLQPRIYVSTGLIALLQTNELRAVLLHEDYHRQRLDPLRSILSEALAAMFFFLPLAVEWRALRLTAAELAADGHAARLLGRSSLAGALHKILSSPLSAPLPVTAGISGLSVTDLRIAALLDDRTAPLRPTGRSLAVSSLILTALCMLVQGPLL